MDRKKYIAPGGWFSMEYPATWFEFEDSADAFLFYNPDKWTGNFRISAFREDSNMRDAASWGDKACDTELKDNPQAGAVQVGSYCCAYSKEDFEEDGKAYTTHLWITGRGETSFECSFTAFTDQNKEVAENIIRSISVRHPLEKFEAEYIPVRLSEISLIDDAFQWASDLVKQQLTIDFQGVEEELPKFQKALDKANFSSKKREIWLNVGIVVCVILAAEAEDLEWQTLIDGNREDPVLIYKGTRVIDPMKLVWSKMKRGEQVSVVGAYEEAASLMVE